MAHVKHYTAASVRDILAHNSRTDNYSNPDIDSSRSRYNYSLSGHDDNYTYYQERLNQVHHMKRANLNTLSSWVITLPKGVRHEDQKRFFEECKNFLDKRYGAENCISADVHFDETTPHLHYTFIPVVHDLKKDRDKVSCKEVFRLKELYLFHNDLNKYIAEHLGYQVAIKTGKTEKNVSINELKTVTKAKIIADAEKEASNIINDARKTKNDWETEGQKEYHRLIDKANAEKAKIDESFANKAQMIRQYELTEADMQKVIETKTKLKKNILGREYISIERVFAEKILNNAECGSATIKMYNTAVDLYNSVVILRQNLGVDEKSKNERERKITDLQNSLSFYKNQNKKLDEENKQYRRLLQENGIIKGKGWSR